MQLGIYIQNRFIQIAFLFSVLFVLWGIVAPAPAHAIINTYCNTTPIFPADYEWWQHDTVAGTYNYFSPASGYCVRSSATKHTNINLQGMLSCNSAGTSATITWNSLSNLVRTHFSIDDTTDGWNASCSGLDRCIDVFSPQTSLTIPTTPGRRYLLWSMNVDSEANGITGDVINGGFFCLAATAVAGACGGNISISWPATPWALFYEVSRDGGAWINVGNVTSWTDSGLVPGSNHSYRYRVTDSTSVAAPSASVSANASNNCANIQPTANAGPDKAITLPTSNSAPTGTSENDPDGFVASRAWTFQSGPTTPTITNGTTLLPTFTNMSVAGTYVFRLTVTDNGGGTGWDEMQVVVSPSVSAPTCSFTFNGATNVTDFDPMLNRTWTWSSTGAAPPDASFTANVTNCENPVNNTGGAIVWQPWLAPGTGNSTAGSNGPAAPGSRYGCVGTNIYTTSGAFPPSAVCTVTTRFKPSAPTGLGGTPGVCGSGAILLSWNPVPNPVGGTTYTLKRNGTSIYTGAATSYNDTGAGVGASPTYTVVTNSPNGTSADSSGVVVTASGACPVNPTNPSESCNAAGTQATLTWNAVGGAATYPVRVDNPAVNCGGTVTGPAPFSCVSNIEYVNDANTGTSIVVNINPSTNYSWWVHSRNAAGDWSPGTSARTINCSPGTPDLVPITTVLPAASVASGGNITMTANARNSGGAATGAGFSTNYTYQWNGTGGAWRDFNPLQTFGKAALAAGANATNDVLSFSTTTTGTLYIQYCVDSGGVIAEGGAGELNNCYVSTGTVVGAAATPDLIPQVVTAPAASVASGGNITLTANARNQGAAATGAGFFTNMTYQWNGTGGAWRDFGTPQNFSKLALAAGATASNDTYTFSTTTTGTLYLQYCVDSTGAISETGGEGNNCYVSAGTVVGAAATPDLIPQVSVAPAASVTTGSNITLTANAYNQGTANAGAFGYFNNITYQWNGTGGAWRPFNPVQTFSKAMLTPGSAATNDTYTFSTTTTGTLYLQYCVDSTNVVAETSGEGNNCYVSAGTIVSAPVPDLIPVVSTAPAGSVTAGNNITITGNARNQGAASTGIGFSNNITYQWNGTGGAWRDFSTPQNFAKPALAAGGNAANDSYTFSTTTTGTLYLQYCVDSTGAITETGGEGNNCYVSAGTVVNAAATADLIPVVSTVPAVSVAAGSNITIVGNARNQGTAATGVGFNNNLTYQWNGTGGAWLNFNPLQVFIKPALAAGGNATNDTYTFSTTTTGTLYLQYCVDSTGAISETGGEGNNCSVSAGTIVSAAAVSDLIPIVTATPTASVASGGNITITANPRNQGSAATGIAFSNDIMYQWGGTGGTWLNFNPAVQPVEWGNIAAGGNGASNSYTFSTTTTGTLYLRYRVDRSNAINESAANESNNTYVSNGTTVTGGASGSITVPTCSIAVGASTCVSSVSWNITSPTSPSVRQNAVQFSTLASSGGTNRNLTYGVNTFTLYDGATLLDTEAPNITCVAGAGWTGSTCVSAPVVSISASPLTIFLGASTTITWNAGLGGTPSGPCVTGGSGFTASVTNPMSGSQVITPPLGNNAYSISCSNAAGTQTDIDTVSVTVNPAVVNPSIVSNKKVVNPADPNPNLTLSYNTGSSAPGTCTVTGPNGYSSGALVAATGSINVHVVSRSVYTITCGAALPSSVAIDIVPTGYED